MNISMKAIRVHGIFGPDSFKPNTPKTNAFGNSGKAVFPFLLACVLAFSGCGRAKVQAKYDGSPEKKQNSAGTLSVILPVDIPETERQNGAAADAEAAVADGEPIHKLTVLPPIKPKGVVEIKEKMFIAQTNDVYLNPEDYMGRTIKLEGLFKTQAPYDESRPPYCFVLRYGPGCCGFDGNAGFEVAWDEDAPPYPVEDDWVEAVGVLKSYEEDGYPYLYLALSSLQVLDQRGEEFVTQ
ncbi:MAG: hypothetical protein LBF77_02995 [Spirochaetaceae bacterium]|jgi:hypothetical protein|nr:hypothetical protein [Spirochaetaceae bacterium]